MRIGVLGGSFDPPQLGHTRLALAAVKELDLDQLIIVPARVSPFKLMQTETAAVDRLEMCRLAFPDFDVSDIEVKRVGASYSVDTLEQLKQMHEGDFWWVGGSDLLKGLPSWRRIDDMVTQCRFAIFYRPGYDCAASFQDLPDHLRSRVDIMEHDSDFPDISSTAVRAKLLSPEESLHPEVYRYIKQRRLYGLD